jgi:hypothetical protein
MTLPDIGTTPLGVTSSDHGQLLTKISQLFNSTGKRIGNIALNLAGILQPDPAHANGFRHDRRGCQPNGASRSAQYHG